VHSGEYRLLSVGQSSGTLVKEGLQKAVRSGAIAVRLHCRVIARRSPPQGLNYQVILQTVMAE
jgi:hypothetical protein